MRSESRFYIWSLAAMVCGAGLMSCTQTKVPVEISQNLQSLKGDILTARSSLQATTAALSNLRDNKGTDLRPQFEAYVKALEDLNAKAGGAGAAAGASSEQAAQYFKQWDEQIKTISDRDLQSASADRRKSAMDEYAKVRAMDADLRVAFRPYMGLLVDIRNAMTADLTQQGLDRTQPTIKKAIEGEGAILERVDRIVKQIDAMS